MDSSTEIINYIFTALFTLETLINIASFGWKSYITKGWNKFDLVILLSSIVSIAISLNT